MDPVKSNNKILFLTLRSDWGGAPKHIDILCKNLSQKFQIYFAAPISEPFGIDWLKIYGKPRFFELTHRNFSFSKLLKLAQFVKKNNIQIIHAHGKGAGLYARLLKILLLGSVNVIFTFHGLHIAQYNQLQKNIYLFYERIASKFTDLFINVSFGEQENCLNNKLFNPLKSKVVYNAIPEAIIQNSKMQLRLQNALPPNKFIILSVVRFSFAKNIEDTIAIAESLKLDNRFYFVLVGDGETRVEIETNIKLKSLNNIFLTGFKSSPLDYIAASDIYLSTSHWEGLPYSLIEASMLGLPIAASNVVGNNEVVQNDKNGKLFKPGDINSATNIIIDTCTNKNLSDLYSANGKVVYRENFSVDKMITIMENIYKSFIN